MSNGRIILEYRDGHKLSRVERPVRDNYRYSDISPEEVASAIRAAAEELILASVGVVDKPE